MNAWKGRLLTVVLVGLVGLFSIHLVDRWLTGLRVDMTASDIYSLSPGSKVLLNRMRDEGVQPVDVTLFFSETAGKTLPRFIKDFITYQRYLKNLLGEYQRAANGKIKVSVVDPVPDTDDGQRASDAGLDGKLINQEGDRFFFGLVFETKTGSREVIDFLWPSEQANVEYEISKTLHRLLWPDRQRLGLLSSLEVMGSAQDPFMAQMLAAQGRQPTEKWIAVELLEELYEVKSIDPTAETISKDDYDLVLVIHPKDLPKKTLVALDDWVVRGGNTLIFLDPYSLDDRPPQNPQQPWAALQYQPASNLDELLVAWGIERPENRFAADLELAVRRPVSQFGAAESVIIDLAIGEDDRAATMDQTLPILRGLKTLRFLLAGVLEPVAGSATSAPDATFATDATAGTDSASPSSTPSGLERLPLITTTAAGGSLVVEPGFGGGAGLAFTDFNNPAKLRDQFVPGTKPVVLAYLLRGRFPSAWPDGAEYPDREPERPPGLPPDFEMPPPEGTEMVHRDPVPEAERADAAVMVFADVDFISDQIAFVSTPFGLAQAANDNHRVLLNSVDYLMGSEELMAIRSTKTLSRPFTLFNDIEAAAEKETLDRERELRAEVETFQEQLRAKQSDLTSRNAALFQKRVQDEVDELNQKIEASNGELRDIRKSRRQALENQESMVRFAVMGWMPLAVLIAGIVFAQRRRARLNAS